MLSQKTKELLLETYRKMHKNMVGMEKYRIGKLIAELEASMDKGVK
jgi:hypothetical protein